MIMFEKTVKQLLQGEFICAYKYPDCYQYLQASEHTEKVDNFLKQLNYHLAHTPQKSAFYAGYQTIDNAARNDIRRGFQNFRSELQPIVDWLALMMDVLHSDKAIMTGDSLSFAQLLQVMEQNASLADRLQSFAKLKSFSSNDSTLKSRLEKLLKTLEDWGYLVLISPDTLVYQVTGKLDYFYQALEFIQEHEGVAKEQADQETAQVSLF